MAETWSAVAIAAPGADLADALAAAGRTITVAWEAQAGAGAAGILAKFRATAP